MNEAHDQIEAELAALRPHDASPELRQRIAEHRAHHIPPSLRWPWALALAGGLAAACGAAILLQWSALRRVEVDRTGVARGAASQPGNKVTPQADGSAKLAARLEAQGTLAGSETARFSWPLDNALTSVIPPDLLE